MRTALALVLLAGCGGGGADVEPDADVTQLPHFSFFVTSLAALQDLSNNDEGFGGDLRYGETGPGAGLRGADKICTEIAERSMPGSGGKQWRAFLSTTYEDAIDRIGPGPWYDRVGRLLAPTLDDMMDIRPQNGDPEIADDFPNEDGVPNHQPDPTMPEVDNHDMLTGSDLSGRLFDENSNCLDWTANSGDPSEGEPWVGHSWPRGFPPDATGGGFDTINSWMSSLIESGCAPGVSLIEMGPPDPNSDTVGSGGGYGGFYCFALVP